MLCEPGLHTLHSEKESVERMLTGHYGLPLVVSAQELRLEDEKCDDHADTEPELVFTLTQSETIVHPLQDVLIWTSGLRECPVYWCSALIAKYFEL